jgi:hypothetical protein
MIPQINLTGLRAQNLRADDVGLHFGHESFRVLVGIGIEEKLADDKTQNRIPQEFQGFVILYDFFRILVRKGPMGQRSVQDLLVPEEISNLSFQFVEHRNFNLTTARNLCKSNNLQALRFKCKKCFDV